MKSDDDCFFQITKLNKHICVERTIMDGNFINIKIETLKDIIYL